MSCPGGSTQPACRRHKDGGGTKPAQRRKASSTCLCLSGRARRTADTPDGQSGRTGVASPLAANTTFYLFYLFICRGASRLAALASTHAAPPTLPRRRVASRWAARGAGRGTAPRTRDTRVGQGDALGDRSFNKAMLSYIDQPENLKSIMQLLRHERSARRRAC